MVLGLFLRLSDQVIGIGSQKSLAHQEKVVSGRRAVLRNGELWGQLMEGTECQAEVLALRSYYGLLTRDHAEHPAPVTEENPKAIDQWEGTACHYPALPQVPAPVPITALSLSHCGDMFQVSVSPGRTREQSPRQSLAEGRQGVLITCNNLQ